MFEDYYDILGIGKDADPQSIRRAYRREAKKSHPDSSGDRHSSKRFRQVEEAYEILGDTERRQAYDQGQRRERGSDAPNPSRPQPGEVPVREGSSSFRAAEAAEPAFGPHFGATVNDSPLLEILLSPREALEGVEVPVEVPFSLPCPECSGGGLWRRMFCFTCAGMGTIRIRKQLVLRIPPGIRSGREFLIDGGDPVGAGIRVRVLVR